MPQHFPNNSKTTLKSPENDFCDFCDPQNSQKWPLKTIKIVQIFIEKLGCWGHLSTFKVENNTQTTPKQPWKSPENDLFDPQNCQNTDVNLAKSVDYRVHFRSTSATFAFLVLRMIKYIVPPIYIRHLKNKMWLNLNFRVACGPPPGRALGH